MITRKSNLKTIMTIITIIVTILLVIFICYALKVGFFESNEALVEQIKQFGIFAPLIFILIQAIQVIFPVIPGGASCLAGVLAFGPVPGFIYNYLGLTIGSIGAYYLARIYGLALINKLFSPKTVDKYLSYLKSKKFEKIFFLGILMPGAPDDLLCYIAGISSLTFPRFLIYILLGKPFTLIFYSLFTKYFL